MVPSWSPTSSAIITPRRTDWPTLAEYAIPVAERTLVYGPGDLQGQPYRVDPFLRFFLEDLYRINPRTGRRVVRRAVLGVGKGNSKTEGAAAVAYIEMFGPAVVGRDGRPAPRHSPDIACGAASFEQADLLFGAARDMAAEIADMLTVYDTEILFADGAPGRLYRVAAAAGTNDGRRPAVVIADEVHEWVGNKERVHLVLTNGLMKRQDSIELNITTAGASLDSVAGRLYEYGKRVASGEVDDPSFLMHWYEADFDLDITDPDELRQAIRQANPASWINVDALASRLEVDRVATHEFRRYHLNQWVTSGEEWIDPNDWLALVESVEVPDGSEVVLGFDGSYKQDATALYGFTLGERPHGFSLGVWENPDDPEWRVPRGEVQARLHEAMRRFRVRQLMCDPYRWEAEIDGWEETFGDIVSEFPTNSRARMTKACGRFYSAVVQGDFTHDGDATVTRHLANAVLKETPSGSYITKDARNSPRKIDAAVAAVIAWEAAAAFGEEQPKEPLVAWI